MFEGYLPLPRAGLWCRPIEQPGERWHKTEEEEWFISEEFPAAGMVEETLKRKWVELHSGRIEWIPFRHHLDFEGWGGPQKRIVPAHVEYTSRSLTTTVKT